MAHDSTQWFKHINQIFDSISNKERDAAQIAIESSLDAMPLTAGEWALAGTWLDLAEPKNGPTNSIILLASPRRLVFSQPGGWTRSPWSFWAGVGAVSSLSISGWIFQQSYGFDHWSNSYLRMDFMFKNLSSLTFYKGYSQPGELVSLAYAVSFLVKEGAKVTNNSQEFEMAYNALP